jgi:hypothetical protein
MVGCAVAFLAVALADVDFQGAGVGSTEPELEAFMANETRQGRPPHTPVACQLCAGLEAQSALKKH